MLQVLSYSFIRVRTFPLDVLTLAYQLTTLINYLSMLKLFLLHYDPLVDDN